jgi:uncharacterized protein (TIRG00374 family)
VSVPRILVGLSAVAGAVLLVLRLPELLRAIGSLSDLGPVVLPAGLALVALGALTRAAQTRSASQLVGIDAPWRRDVELSATTYATNKVVKAGGFAGLVHHLADADRRGYHRPSVTAAYLASKVADTIAFSALVVVVMGSAWLSGALHGAELVAAVVTLGYVGVLVAGLVLLARSPDGARRISRRVRGLLRRGRCEPAPSDAEHEGTLDEIARLFATARGDRARTRQVLGSALAGKVVGFATLWLVADALGLSVGVVPLAAIYVLGLAAALVGPLPGGLGATEASLTALLLMAGVASPVAGVAVVGFRLFDFWLPTLVGLSIGTVVSRVRRESPAPAPAVVSAVGPMPAEPAGIAA